MSSKDCKLAFDAAKRRLADAEREFAATLEHLASAQDRLEKANEKRAGHQREMNAIVDAGGSIDEALAKTAKIVAAKQQVESEITVLARFRDNLKILVDASEVRIAVAQKDCHSAQREYANARYPELLDDFFKKNREGLLELARAAYHHSLWNRTMPGFGYDQVVGPQTFAKYTFAQKAIEFFQPEDVEHAAIDLTKSALPVAPIRSMSLSNEQHLALENVVAVDEREIRKALEARLVQPSEPAFDPSKASHHINEFERLISENTIRVDAVREHLKQKPNDPALLDDLREGEAIIARQQRSLKNWQDQLIAWRARQAA